MFRSFSQRIGKQWYRFPLYSRGLCPPMCPSGATGFPFSFNQLIPLQYTHFGIFFARFFSCISFFLGPSLSSALLPSLSLSFALFHSLPLSSTLFPSLSLPF